VCRQGKYNEVILVCGAVACSFTGKKHMEFYKSGYCFSVCSFVTCILHQELTGMKNLLFLLVLTILLNSCASTNKMANESIHNAIIGQNETIVCNRLGMPTRIEHASDGGKVMIYEHYSKGMFLTPYRYKINYRDGIVLSGAKYSVTNDPKYTIYQTNVSYLKVYLDKQGNAIRIEQTMPQEQLEIYHERFKHFHSKD
jgi:hypothetical protein